MKQILWFIGITLSLIACEKETETLNYSSLTDYYPLQVGRTLTYRLDSTVIPPFGTSLNEVSYLAKDSIESSFTDAQGSLSYRVFRFTTDTLRAQPWQYKSTYFITPSSQSVEVIDDHNLRYIKLKIPIRENFTWKGNAYIDTRSASSPVQYLDNWDYTYQNVDLPFTTAKGTFDSTITVMQRDEDIPEGPFDPQFYKQRNYSIEVYAKGIGLVYKEFLHYTWQTTPPPSKYEDDSYGIKLSLIDYK
jgi:hypothetical protein